MRGFGAVQTCFAAEAQAARQPAELDGTLAFLVDQLGTVLRQGCESVAQYELLPRPPDERPASAPWGGALNRRNLKEIRALAGWYR